MDVAGDVAAKDKLDLAHVAVRKRSECTKSLNGDDVRKECQTDVDQEIRTATCHEEDTNRWHFSS